MKKTLVANIPQEILPSLEALPWLSYDFIIQNNSNSDVYFLDSLGQATSDGIKIAAGGASISKDHWQKSIILLSTANVDINMAYQLRTDPALQPGDVTFPDLQLVKDVRRRFN